MAKIKVGDKVRVKGMSGIWTVSELTSPVKVEVKSDDGFVASVALKSVTLANSRACNAKFKPGDKVTWQHHNGSYSNEVIDYIVPPNGYAFRDGGIGAESEIRAGWVPESQTGRANMPPLNSRARNGVRSRNAVVAKALNACGTARNATFGSVEDAERYSEQAVKAAKSRVFSEMGTLKDVVRALKGYPDSKTVQKNLLTLEWALEEIKKAAQTLS